MSKRFVAHRPKPRPIDPAGAAAARRAEPDPGRAGAGLAKTPAAPDPCRPKEIGGPSGPEPTRYGDWERKGICVDF